MTCEAKSAERGRRRLSVRASSLGVLALLAVLLVGVVAGPDATASPVGAAEPVGDGALPVAAAGPVTGAGAAIELVGVDPGIRDSIVRLYGAVFDRDPDPEGLTYWVGAYVNGRPLPGIATWFMSAPEWTATYGEVDDGAFVDLLYRNVLDRDPDAGGREYWMGRLAGGLSRTSMLLGFSESPENVARTGTASPVKPSPPLAPPPPGSGSGRRIVYSNSMQRVWLVEAGERVIDTYLVSGRRGVPAAGTYHVYSKSPLAWAGHDGITMEHMVRFAWGRLSIGFHAIPHYSNGQPMQTEAQLGTFQSGGCVRQADRKAAALYEWAPIGTTVVVLP